jgi:hypothetical protein
MSASTVISLILRGRDDGASAALDAVAGKTGGLGDTLSGLAGVGRTVATGLGIVGGAATAAGAVLVGLGSDVEEMQGKFNVVFAETGGQVVAALDEFGAAVGRNKFELHGMAAQFGDLLKPMGFTEEAAASMAIGLTELATDLSSFNNMPMDEAARRLQGTLIGAHQNALQFGVVINENTLAAEMLAQGWNELTGAELEAAKVQARLNLLMRGTTDAQGDAARTAGSWANQMRALKSSLTETAQEIGLELLPAVTPLLQALGNLVADLLPPLVNWFTGSVIPAFREFTDLLAEGDIHGVLEKAFGPEIAGAILNVAAEMGSFIKDVVLPFVRDHAEELKGAIIGIAVVLGAAVLLSALASAAAAVAFLVSPVGLVIVAAGLLGAAWRTNMFGIRDWTDETIPKVIAWWEDLMVTWDQLVFIIGWGVDQVIAWWGDVTTTWEQLVFIVGWGAEQVGIWFDGVADSVREMVGTIQERFDAAMAAVQPFIDAIQNFAAWLRSNVLEIKVNLPSLPSWATPGSPIPLHTAWADYHNFLERNQFEPRFDLDQVPAMPNGSGRPQLRPVAGSQPRTVIERIEVHIHDTAAAELFLAHLDALSDDAGLAF